MNDIILHSDYLELPIYRKNNIFAYTKIDKEKYELIKNFKLFYGLQGVYFFINKKSHLLHRFLIESSGYIIKHKNKDKLDNRLSNLLIHKLEFYSDIIFHNDYTEIKIISKNKQQSVLIDNDDYNKIKEYYLDIYGSGQYVRLQKIGFKTCYLHRFIMNAPKHLYVDHINHNTFDNRKNNLRLVTNKQNCENRKGCYKISKSGHRGISPLKNKWRVSITSNYKHIFIGIFNKLEEAILARDQAYKNLGFLNSEKK